MVKYIVGLYHDMDLENPTDNDSNWRIISFLEGAPDQVMSDAIKKKVERGDAWMLSYTPNKGGGDCLWTLSAKTDQWVEADAVLFWTGVIEELAPSRQEREDSARALLKEYTDWCNGTGYSYKVEVLGKCPTCGCKPKKLIAHEVGFLGVAVDYMCDEIRNDIAIHAASVSIPLDAIKVQVKGNASWLAEQHKFVPQPA